MNKSTIKKILSRESINQQEASEFIVDYCKMKKNEDITSEQLSGIMQAIQMGLFNLQYAAEQAAIQLGIDVVQVIGKQGEILKTIVDGK